MPALHSAEITVAAIGGIVIGLWASVPVACQILLILMILDFASGVIAAFTKGKMSSAVGRKGIGRKVMIWLVVLAAIMVTPFFAGVPVGTAVCGFYSVMEAISLVENAGRAGAPVPTFLKRGLEKLRDQMDGDEGRPS